MRKILFIILAGLSSPATAQSQTTCRTIGNVTNCEHEQRTAPLDYGAQMRAGQALVPNYQDDELKEQQARALQAQSRAIEAQTRDREQCRKQIGKAIDAAQYELAKSLADTCR